MQSRNDNTVAADLTRICAEQLAMFGQLGMLPDRDHEMSYGAGKVNDSYLKRIARGDLDKLLHRLDRLYTADHHKFMPELHAALLQKPGRIDWVALVTDPQSQLQMKENSVKEYWGNSKNPDLSDPKTVVFLRAVQQGIYDPVCFFTLLGVAFMPLWVERGRRAAASTAAERNVEGVAACKCVLTGFRAAAAAKNIVVGGSLDINSCARHQDARELYPAFASGSTVVLKSAESLWHTAGAHMKEYVRTTCMPVRRRLCNEPS